MSQLKCDISVFCDLSSFAEAIAATVKGRMAKNFVFIILLQIGTLIPVPTLGLTAIGNVHPKPSMSDSVIKSAVLSEDPLDHGDVIIEAFVGNIERHQTQVLKKTILAATTASAVAQIKVRVLGNDALKPKISRRKVWIGDAALLTMGSGTPPYEVTIENRIVAYAKKLNETTYLIVGIVPGETIIMIGDAKGLKDTAFFEVLNSLQYRKKPPAGQPQGRDSINRSE